MAESAVSFVVTKLSGWIWEQSQLLGGLRAKAEFIRDELDRMKAFLRLADEKEELDPVLKTWVTQVRDLAYDAEDAMDKFTLRFAHDQEIRYHLCGSLNCIYLFIKNFKYRCQISVEIQSLHDRVKSISEVQQRYTYIYDTLSTHGDSIGDSTITTRNSWYDSRGDALLLEESEVVGIEKPKEQLIEWLSPSDFSNAKVISVVGPGGLGKTTLVRKVYDDAMIRMQFSIHVWVTVSNTLNLEALLRNIIRKLVAEVRQKSPRELKEMDTNEMKEFIYKFLKHRTYIIVLDDVWTLSAWEAVRYAFPRAGTSGSIIITTRFRNIGHVASTESNGHVYNLKPLSSEDSQTLFCKKAFSGNTCPLHLGEIAEMFLKRCEGLPLAIIVIGSLLASKGNNIEDWRKFYQCLGDELEGDHRVTKLLSLNYYDLPYHLKSCFLYFSVFPEDHRILKRRLIRLWIAEGFVQTAQGKSMEDVADGYIKELLDRGLIEIEAATSYGNPDRIRVHDILHKIIVSKSREQNFVTIANGQNICTWPCRSRRLSIHGCKEHMDAIGGSDHIRSMLVLEPQSKAYLSKLLRRSSKLMKVLELRGGLTEKIPEEVFDLYHLRYLSLKNTQVNIVPKMISKLQSLETLDLRDTKVTELPGEIVELRKLRHLMVYYYKSHRGYRPFNNVHSCRAPYKIGCLSSLQTLSDIDATEAGDDTTIVREIGKLSELKRLGIMKLRRGHGKDLCSSLRNLTGLESLHIASASEEEMMDLQYPLSPMHSLEMLELRGCLEKVPIWIPSLDGLTMLHLRWSKMNEDPLEALQNLPNLAELELYQAYKGKALCFKSSGFPRLKKLWLLRLDGLRWVNVEVGSMPLLENLYMWGCKLVEEPPSGIEHLAYLQYVDFSDMTEEFVTSLVIQKECEGDNWKLSRIPSIEIYSLVGDEWKGRYL